MSQPHFGNSKLKFKQTLAANDGNGNPKEYQVSAWLAFNNGWDDANNRPMPMTDQQRNLIEGLYDDLAACGVELQITMKDRAGSDPKQWPICGRMRMFVNAKDKDQNSSGGGSDSAW